MFIATINPNDRPGFRNYLKKVFLSGVARSAKTDWPNLGVGREYQILEILYVFLRFNTRARLACQA